jgi:ABC-type transport system substrate-binding protein
MNKNPKPMRFECVSVRRNGRRFLAIGVIFAMVFIVFQVTITEALAAEQPIRTLVVAMGEPVDSGNPYVGVNDNAYVFYSFIYDDLITPGADSLPIPSLARSWWYMDGPTAASLGSNFDALSHNQTPTDWPLGSIWEYNITRDVFWNDGEPFTADDVVWTINIQIGSNFANYWAYQPYTRWIDHAEKINDYKVRVFFSDVITLQPFSIAFGDNLFIPIMPKHIFKDEPASFIAQGWDGTPSIATGPFMGTNNLGSELVAKETITLVKNQYYNFTDSDGVGKGLGYANGEVFQMDRIELKFFSEESTLALAVRTGDADVGQIQASTYFGWKNDASLPKSVNLISILGSTDYSKQIVLNAYEQSLAVLNPLRLDPAVQRATALATNKTYIKDNVYKGLAEIGVGLISPATSRWYWEPGNEISTFNVMAADNTTLFSYSKPMKNVMDHNVTLANQILDAAGYVWTGEVGKSPRKAGPIAAARMHALFNSIESDILNTQLAFELVSELEVFEDKSIGDFVTSDWEKVGIWIQGSNGDHVISLVNSATWNTLIYTYQFNAMQTYWSGDIDANYLLYGPTTLSLQGWNEFGTTSPVYDALYLKQAITLNYTARKHWVDECQKWQYLSGSIITLVYPEKCFAINNHTWKNWGDWVQYPRIAIDGFWSSNPLYSMLKYDPDAATTDYTTMLIAAGVVVVLIAVFAVRTIRRKKKERGMEQEEEEEQPPNLIGPDSG